MHVTAAPKTAKKVAAQTAYTRQAISKLSKEEQHNGASPDARRAIATKFKNNLKSARAAIAEAEDAAAARDRAALLLRSPTSTTPTSDIERKAYACALLGCDAEPLAVTAEHSASRYRDALDRAETRLCSAADDIAATLALIDLNEQLPRHGWDVNAKALRASRTLYQTHIAAARNR